MDIKETPDQMPVEYPEPVAPGKQPVHEPSPVVEPAKEPAHAALQVSMSERDTWTRCGRG